MNKKDIKERVSKILNKVDLENIELYDYIKLVGKIIKEVAFGASSYKWEDGGLHFPAFLSYDSPRHFSRNTLVVLADTVFIDLGTEESMFFSAKIHFVIKCNIIFEYSHNTEYRRILSRIIYCLHCLNEASGSKPASFQIVENNILSPSFLIKAERFFCIEKPDESSHLSKSS